MITLNGDTVPVTLFPDGTSQVWKLDKKHFSQEKAMIVWEFSHESELFHIAQLKQLLDTYGVDRSYLYLTYLPYGRQDKPTSNDATFALRTFATVINSLRFAEIVIMDPHSTVATEVIRNSRAIYPFKSLDRVIEITDSDLICYPDNGALVKYGRAYRFQLPHIHGEKVRDQATGYISSYKVVGNCYDKRVLIVDDICDGGKTFELLAKDLYEDGATEVTLFVTHGLFTKGLRPLKNAGITRIFTNKGEAVTMADGGFGFRNLEK